MRRAAAIHIHGFASTPPIFGHALAILPGLTHYNLAISPLFAAVALDFLDGPQNPG